MRRFLSLPKPLVFAVAVVFSAAAVLYSMLWMYSIRWMSQVELGFDFNYIGNQHCEYVKTVEPGGPADRAGLTPGSRIIAINGRPIDDRDTLYEIWAHQKPGNTVELAVLRDGATTPVTLWATFRERRSPSK